MARTGSVKQSAPERVAPERHNRTGVIAPDVHAAAATAFARAGFRDPTLVLRWPDIAGADIARLSTPIKLVDSPNGATLTLKTEPGAALLLQHESRALCDRINTYLGRTAVTRLRFVQGTLADRPKPVATRRRMVDAPPDDAAFRYQGPKAVRAALINLARARAATRPTD